MDKIQQVGKFLFNLRLYIQHLMDENEDEDETPLNHENWVKQTNWKFIKYVIHHKHSMTPKQLKQKPFEESFKKQHENLDTEEGESSEEENKSTTSPEKSEQDYKSDTTDDDTHGSEPTTTYHTNQVLNNTLHEEENSSEAESDTSEDENVDEMQTYESNGEQNEQESKLLTTNFEVKVENRKVEGIMIYSTDQQIFKFKVNSGTDQEVWVIYIDLQSIHGKWTIDPIYNIWVLFHH